MRQSRKLRRTRVDEGTKIARSLGTVGFPSIQAERGGFQVVDVANHSDADQRHMVRSGEKRTVRKRTHIEKLALRLSLDQREAAACQWYADAHAQRYDTLGITSAYGEQSRASKTNFDHLPNTLEQDMAAEQFGTAREAISPPLRLMFDRIILQGWHVGQSTEFLFRLAVGQLMHCIEGFVAL